MTQTLAPIAFFCYNRPDHTRRTLEALKANELASDTKLFIFSDGAKDDEKSREGVAKVREYIRTVDGFASVEIIEREKNYGCDRNVYDGVTRIVNEFGRIIVIEDDILTSRYFLHYMNDALELYKDDDKAGAVSGYLKPRYADKGFPQTFFSNDAGFWGWATWLRAWKDFESEIGRGPKKIRKAGLEKSFNYGFKSKPLTRTLKKAVKLFIWDYQFGATLFLHGRYILKPQKAFSNNIGFDGTGVHCGVADYWENNVPLTETYTPLEKIPVELNKQADEIYREIVGENDHSIPYRIVHKLHRIFYKLLNKIKGKIK